MRQKRIAESDPSAAFRTAFAIFALLGGAALAGCSSLPPMPSLPWSTPSMKDNASAETLYNEGVKLLSDKKYVPAIERFQKLRSDYPFAPELVNTDPYGSAWMIKIKPTDKGELGKLLSAADYTKIV